MIKNSKRIHFIKKFLFFHSFEKDTWWSFTYNTISAIKSIYSVILLFLQSLHPKKMFFPPIPWKNSKSDDVPLSLVNSAHKNHMIHIWIGKYHLLDDSWQIFCFGQPKTSKFINFLLRNSNNNQFTVLYFRLEEGNKNWEKKGWIEKT